MTTEEAMTLLKDIPHLAVCESRHVVEVHYCRVFKDEPGFLVAPQGVAPFLVWSQADALPMRKEAAGR